MVERYDEVITPSLRCHALIKDLNLKYRFLSIHERDAHIPNVINYLKKDIVPSESARKPSRERFHDGWTMVVWEKL